MSQLSVLDLFRLDASTQVQAPSAGLLALERAPDAAGPLETCMRAAHSLKGAAHVVGLVAGVAVAHAMEECLVAAQRGSILLHRRQIDVLLHGVDLLSRIANTLEADIAQWGEERQSEIDGFLNDLAGVLAPAGEAPAQNARPAVEAPPSAIVERRADPERALRVTVESLNRLLGVAAESLVESRRIHALSASLLRLKRLHDEAVKALDGLSGVLGAATVNGRAKSGFTDVQQRVLALRASLSERIEEVDAFEHRSTTLAQRLYDEALACRMRPFADGVRAFPRVARDLARSLGKEVRLEILGETTRLDRDMLENLEAPLGHLLRNAIDHGIESPDERRAAGKPAEGVVSLEARHMAGWLHVIVADDGRGIDVEGLRKTVVERNLTTAKTAETLSEPELLAFLFLPGFTMKSAVTDISGRGVGLDAVQTTIKHVRGSIQVSTVHGKGTRFRIQMPLSLSVVRTLLVEVGGEPYAFPLASIVRTLMLPREQVALLEGRQFFTFDGRPIGLVSARHVLQRVDPHLPGDALPVIVVGDGEGAYGIVADRFVGERDLVVQPLDPRLGKIKDIAAGALMEDGTPVLIVDVDDMMRSVERLIATGHLSTVQRADSAAKRPKRVLVVDDSLTVRELERKLLDNAGYEVEVAVDGMDAWNAVRTGRFDLVVTDVDMPRMDGIELVILIKKDVSLTSVPVMIVSYKDRAEDRQRGLDAGADYYLTKAGFHDEMLLQAVVDLIGEAAA